jgi:hypothetical protein
MYLENFHNFKSINLIKQTNNKNKKKYLKRNKKPKEIKFKAIIIFIFTPIIIIFLVHTSKHRKFIFHFCLFV